MAEADLTQIINNAPKTLQLGELENEVLTIALTNREFFYRMINVLGGQHFDVPEHKQLWNFFQRYFNRYKKPPTVKEINHAVTKLGISLQLPEKPTESSKEYVIDEVHKLIRAQEYEKFLIKAIMETSSKGEPNYDDLYKDFQKIVYFKSNNFDKHIFINEVDRYLEGLTSYWTNRIPTGFPSLDKMLAGGGLGQKELVAFAGPAKRGKSVWLTAIGANLIRNGYTVIHITRELSQELTLMRYWQNFLNQSQQEYLGNISDTKINMLNFLDGLCREANIAPPLTIVEFPTDGVTIDQTRAYVNMLKERDNLHPDVIIDDYLDIAKPMRAVSSYDSLGYIFADFRGWMQEDKLIGITATQTNRGAELTEGPIKQHQVGDSIKKVRIVDAMFTINESEQDVINQEQQLYLATSRNSKTGLYARFKVDKERMVFKDMNQITANISSENDSFNFGGIVDGD